MRVTFYQQSLRVSISKYRTEIKRRESTTTSFAFGASVISPVVYSNHGNSLGYDRKWIDKK